MFTSPHGVCRRVAVLLLPVYTCLALAPAYANDGRSSSEPRVVTQPGADGSTEVPVLALPLLPELFGPALIPVDIPAPVLEQSRAVPNAPPARPLTPPSSFQRGLIPLFAGYAALQALDVHSTLTVINRGGAEANGLMAPLVNHPAAFVAFKAAMTTTTLLAAERLSKRNRFAAYALMFGMTSAYAFVVAHNYRIANSLR